MLGPSKPKCYFCHWSKRSLSHLRISYQSLAGSLSSLQKSRSKYSSPCLTPQSLSVATLMRDAQWQIKSCNYPFNQVFLWKATSLANECQINVKPVRQWNTWYKSTKVCTTKMIQLPLLLLTKFLPYIPRRLLAREKLRGHSYITCALFSINHNIFTNFLSIFLCVLKKIQTTAWKICQNVMLKRKLS